MEKIISLENNLFKKIKKLKTKKGRDEFGLYIYEGDKLLANNKNLSLYLKPSYIILCEQDEFSRNFENILQNINLFDCPKYIFSKKLFNEISSQENSQGIILIYSIPTQNNLSSCKSDFVVVDKVSDPGNLGTIIRICDATDFKNIILIEGSVDPYNEKTVRATMGSIHNVNIFKVSSEVAIKYLKENNYNILVTTLSEDSISYTKMKLQDKNAFVFGSEGSGVSDEFINCATSKINIPMYGNAESLNVGVATAVILYKAKEMS